MVDGIDLDQIAGAIDDAFGVPLPVAGGATGEAELAALRRAFESDDFQAWLQDEIHRQIIRDYLLNAAQLGLVDDAAMARYRRILASADGRALLALHMVVSPVEHAGSLPDDVLREELHLLRPDGDSPLQLVRN